MGNDKNQQGQRPPWEQPPTTIPSEKKGGTPPAKTVTRVPTGEPKK